MTTLTALQLLQSIPAPRRPGLFAALRARLARLRRAMEADTARRHLGDLPDHLLRDIGVSRFDLPSLDL